MPVPQQRIVVLNDAAPRAGARYVLYWMTSFRRPHYNFALDRAAEIAATLKVPLLVLEALRIGYRWASDRIHQFILDGMADNSAAFARARIAYRAYLEPEEGAGKGLVEALSEHAAAVVTDDYPCFFLPRMVAAASERIRVRFEMVDSNGLIPLRATDRAFLRAVDFRRFLQRSIPPHLAQAPRAKPLRGSLPELGPFPRGVTARYKFVDPKALERREVLVGKLKIDHGTPVVSRRGGHRAAERELRTFVERRLENYAEARNHPDLRQTSGLSPYLHFGHISAHQVFEAVAKAEEFDFSRAESFGGRRRGEREGFWEMRPGAEAFLDQLVTWRELGFNLCQRVPGDYDRYASLPSWSRATLEKHARDRRPHLYTLEQLAAAETYDPVWNAAQRELRSEGTIHNYLRMLWGKKVLEWSRSPEEGIETLIALNDQYAIDGRDPNSYSGIFWCFGRYDRPWGPERQIFGTVRYMSSENTRRKLKLDRYLERWSA